MSSINAGSFADRICSSVTNFLDKESAKADTAVKDCKEKCDWAKKKQKLIASAQKKANNSCDKGIAPDMSEISKGLDKTAIKKLNKLYKDNAGKMFDGAEELAAKDFNIDSNQAPTLIGSPASGNVMSLKSGTPDIGTLNKSAVASLEQTTSGSITCDNCLLGGLAPNEACAEVCCDERGDSWCSQLCSKYPNNVRCEKIKKTDNWFTKTVNWIKSIFTSEEKGRPLTQGEIDNAKKIFGYKIDYSKVRLVTSGSGNPRTSGHTIYIPDYDSDWDQGIFMHEMTHIYQKENYKSLGYNWLTYRGEKLFELLAPMVPGQWGEDARLGLYVNFEIENKPFSDYKLEQQSQLVKWYYSDSIKQHPDDKIRENGRIIKPEEIAVIKEILLKEGLLK